MEFTLLLDCILFGAYYCAIWTALLGQGNVHPDSVVGFSIAAGVVAIIATIGQIHLYLDEPDEKEKSVYNIIPRFWSFISLINFIVYVVLRRCNVIHLPHSVILTILLGLWFLVGAIISMYFLHICRGSRYKSSGSLGLNYKN